MSMYLVSGTVPDSHNRKSELLMVPILQEFSSIMWILVFNKYFKKKFFKN